MALIVTRRKADGPGIVRGRSVEDLHARIIGCRACPRLVRWRERVAREKVRRFDAEEYWGKPIPGFGDRAARLAVVGLAPAAHGGNRTGRMFTGDESGNWLFRALYRAGFANQARSVHRDDGLQLRDCYILAAVRCAPPANKPVAREFERCRPFLVEELSLLEHVRVIVGLGKVGFDAAVRAGRSLGKVDQHAHPRFAHGALYRDGALTLIASYHPSQQNTFTGRLTERMLDDVFTKAVRAIEEG